MSRVFHTSDAHRGHPFVATLRGFASPAEHDAAQDDMVRSTITKRDTVWWHGDMTSGGNIPAMLEWVKSLPGTHHLVAGNHCPVHPMHSGAQAKQRAYLDAFASVQHAASRRIAGRKVMLSHFPYERDRPGVEARSLQWRLPNEGKWLLHGHTHGPERVTVRAPRIVAFGTDGTVIREPHGTKEIHVGLDAWDLQLVPEATIAGLIEAHS